MSFNLFKHYLIVAVRNLKKHKVSSFLSLMGLAAAFALSITSLNIAWDAKNSDSWLDTADNLYLVQRHSVSPQGDHRYRMTSNGILANLIKERLPNVRHVVRLNKERASVQVDSPFPIQINRFLRVDENFAEAFPLDVKYGDYAATLSDPRGLVLSSEVASEVFGDRNPVGQTMEVTIGNRVVPYTVGAVLEPLRTNTHFEIGTIAQLVESDFALDYCGLFRWSCTGREMIYVLTNHDANISDINTKIEEIKKAAMPPSPSGGIITFELVPLVGILWQDRFQWGPLAPLADKNAIIGMTLAALILLISAIVNHVNIATSIAVTRGKSNAIRKVLGARRWQLKVQHLSESIFLVILAYGFSFVLIDILTPFVNTMTGSNLNLYSGDYNIQTLIGLLIAIMIGLLAGLYPAFIQERTDIAEQLRANQSSMASSSGRTLRSALVLLQVACGVGLVLATSAIYNQIMYLQTMDKGFNYSGVMHVPVSAMESEDQKTTFKQQILNINSISDATLSTAIPFINDEWRSTFRNIKDNSDVALNFLGFDDNFLNFYQVKPLAGRLLQSDIALDREHVETDEGRIISGNVIINEAALNELGFSSPQEAVGKTFGYDITYGGERHITDYTIVGVLPNVSFFGGETMTRPFYHSLENEGLSFISLRITDGDLKQVLSSLESLWGQFVKDRPFEYSYSDENLKEAYAKDIAAANLLSLITIAAIFLGVAGLYSLARLTVSQRKQEIALRRVLGAKNSHVLKLFAHQLYLPIVGGIMLGLTTSLIWINDWLAGFEFINEPSTVMIGGIIIMVILVAALTTFVHALDVIRLRPADVLRDQ